MSRTLRMGMVGGGMGSQIGGVHRTAAQADQMIELTAGAFSSTRPKSFDSGKELGLPTKRIYGTYRDMLRAEAKLPAEERIDFVSIVTPTNMHYPVAMAALDAGLHVACEMPMTTSLDEAENLVRKIDQTGKLFCLVDNFTGYPMVNKAREMVIGGQLGAVRRVVVEYPQGWLSTRVEATGQKQAAWRTNPRNAGLSCCIADVGCHCESLAAFITGSTISDVSSDLSVFVKGRVLDDDGSVLLRFENGARGVLWASQIAVGEEHALAIRVYGEKGSLAWNQKEPNALTTSTLDGSQEVLSASAQASDSTEYPDGYIDAFASVYRRFSAAISKDLEGKKLTDDDIDFATATDGLRGMKFICGAVDNSSSDEKWTPINA